MHVSTEHILTIKPSLLRNFEVCGLPEIPEMRASMVNAYATCNLKFVVAITASRFGLLGVKEATITAVPGCSDRYTMRVTWVTANGVNEETFRHDISDYLAKNPVMLSAHIDKIECA